MSDEQRAEPPGDEQPPTQELPSTQSAPRAPENEDSTLFASGDLVAGRYLIVRFLDAGGAGEVYEAEDRELREHVALKAVGRVTARDRTRYERLRREVQLARRVTHPNVCRLYDVGRHPLGDGDDVMFLTMELLEGETLAARLFVAGAYAPADALPLLRQIAAGLDAAHRAGVIHRDFKSGNVMLVRDPREPAALRAVVTDFGLAAAMQEDSSSSITASGAIVGTPSYMAPEQVEGAAVTAAADVYAFGIVAYEMMTGELPFTGASPLSVAVKRLQEPPPPPRQHAPDLDPEWEHTILRCLERQPDKRFASAGAAVVALAGEAPLTRRGRARPWTWLAIAAGLAGVALFALFHAPPAGPNAKARPAVAVLGFKNASERRDAAWLSTALAEMLATEVAAGERVRTVPGEQVERVKLELALPDAESLTPATLRRLRASLGSDYVLLGAYTALAGADGLELRLDLCLQDAASGETLLRHGEVGGERELFALVDRAGAAIRARLGLQALAPAEAGAVRAARPANPRAAERYAAGLERLRRFDPLGARDALAAAVATDPDFSLAHAALAEAWSGLGYDAKARGEAQRAYELAGGLPRADRLQVEARFHETERNWDAAIAAWRDLTQIFPDDLDNGLHLAAALTQANRPKDAQRVLAGLRELPPPAADDPRLALAAARAANDLSDFAGQQRAAVEAAERGKALGAGLLVAHAKLEEGAALHGLGRPAEALRAYVAAQAAFAAAGDQSNQAHALRSIAELRREQGDLAAAHASAEQALAVFRRVGDEAGMASALGDIANGLYQTGDLTAAVPRYEEALRLRREIGDQKGAAVTLGNLANVYFVEGDLDQAVATHDEALQVKRAIGFRSGEATSLIGLAAALQQRGDLDAARARAEEAVALCRATGEKTREAHALFWLGEALAARGNLEAAAQAHDQALAIRTRLGERGGMADSRLAIAMLALDQGRAAEAEEGARRAAGEYHAEGDGDGEGNAEAVLARALLARGDLVGARGAIAGASALAAQSAYQSFKISTDIDAARVVAATGDAASARRRLAAARQQAQARGMAGLALEARLAAAEIARRGHEPGAGAELVAIARDARQRGFGLVAERAAHPN